MSSTTSPETTAILACMNGLLSSINSSPESMLAFCIPTAGAATMRGGQLQNSTIAELCHSIRDIPGHKEERFIDPEVKVSPDGNLAMIWAKNEVKLDGQVVSEGVNAISLHKVEGIWKITGISDTAPALPSVG